MNKVQQEQSTPIEIQEFDLYSREQMDILQKRVALYSPMQMCLESYKINMFMILVGEIADSIYAAEVQKEENPDAILLDEDIVFYLDLWAIIKSKNLSLVQLIFENDIENDEKAISEVQKYISMQAKAMGKWIIEK